MDNLLNNPIYILFIICFLIFPAIVSGKMGEELSIKISSFIAMIIASPAVLIPYVLIIYLISLFF